MSRNPLWFKDAIIYELHVRSFFDSTGSGVGDFAGLTKKLPYLQDLGVTCLWLLPFYPSPLRDDGYDIADYRTVNPIYGSLDDFKRFVEEGPRARPPGADRTGGQPHVGPAPVVSGRRAARRRARRSATITCGATPMTNTRARASSFSTPKSQTGRSTRSPASTTGTGSSRISPTSISTTRRCSKPSST